MRNVTKRQLGRPPIPAEQRKRYDAHFRMTEALRSQLSAAADQAGRSLSEEIEHRLELSLAGESWLLPETLTKRIAAGEVEILISRDKRSQPQGIVAALLPSEPVPAVLAALETALGILNSEIFIRRLRRGSIDDQHLENARMQLRIALAAVPGSRYYEKLHEADPARPLAERLTENLIIPLPSPRTLRWANQPTEVQQARQRVVDKVLAEIAGDWRFVVKHGRTKKGAWWYRADKVWLQDQLENTVFNKIRSACRDVSYDITQAGGSAALAREISSWETMQSVLQLAEQQCMARAEDMPPGLGVAAPLTRTKRS